MSFSIFSYNNTPKITVYNKNVHLISFNQNYCTSNEAKSRKIKNEAFPKAEKKLKKKRHVLGPKIRQEQHFWSKKRNFSGNELCAAKLPGFRPTNWPYNRRRLFNSPRFQIPGNSSQWSFLDEGCCVYCMCVCGKRA